MDLHRLGRAAAFVTGCIVGGLALAFVIVFVHPQLLLHPGAAPVRFGPTSPTSPTSAAAAAAPADPSVAPTPTAPAVPAATVPSPLSAKAPGTTADSTVRASGVLDPALPAATESFARAVRRASPAVVNISTQRLVTEQTQNSMFDQIFGDLQPYYRHRVERALGSGVIIDSAGHIITNNHVIANADTIMVHWPMAA